MRVVFTIYVGDEPIICESSISHIGYGSNNDVYLVKEIESFGILPEDTLFVLKISKYHKDGPEFIKTILTLLGEVNPKQKGKLFLCKDIAIYDDYSAKTLSAKYAYLMPHKQLIEEVCSDLGAYFMINYLYQCGVIILDIHGVGNFCESENELLDAEWAVYIRDVNPYLLFTDKDVVSVYETFASNFFEFYKFHGQKQSIPLLVRLLARHVPVKIPTLDELYADGAKKPIEYLPYIWTMLVAADGKPDYKILHLVREVLLDTYTLLITLKVRSSFVFSDKDSESVPDFFFLPHFPLDKVDCCERVNFIKPVVKQVESFIAKTERAYVNALPGSKYYALEALIAKRYVSFQQLRYDYLKKLIRFFDSVIMMQEIFKIYSNCAPRYSTGDAGDAGAGEPLGLDQQINLITEFVKGPGLFAELPTDEHASYGCRAT